jgi:hypothetical protein
LPALDAPPEGVLAAGVPAAGVLAAGMLAAGGLAGRTPLVGALEEAPVVAAGGAAAAPEVILRVSMEPKPKS